MTQKEPVPAPPRPLPEDVFLFVNPKSGGNRGEEFLKVPQPFLVHLGGDRQASLQIYSLLSGASGEHEGFKRLREAAAKRGPVRTIVGGGDGTVMWVDSEATKHGIHTPTQLTYGIVPLGTGNDFARVAGWGGKNPRRILEDGCSVLRKLVRAWCTARARPHDVWQVTIKVDSDYGDILVVDKHREEAPLHSGATMHTVSMINYFSIGQESKVGIEFDKHRTKSQTCNLFVYACEGCWTEAKCCSQQHIGNLVRSMHLGTSAEGRVLMGDPNEDDEWPALNGNPESLMFLNVNSYAGGHAHFWQRDLAAGVDPAPRPEEIDVQEDPGDGRLEVVTLPNIVDIPLDRLDHLGKRVFSGAPFYIEFFQTDKDEDEEANLDVYCEVDGEFFHLVNPESVTIVLSKTLQVLQSDGPG